MPFSYGSLTDVSKNQFVQPTQADVWWHATKESIIPWIKEREYKEIHFNFNIIAVLTTHNYDQSQSRFWTSQTIY